MQCPGPGAPTIIVDCGSIGSTGEDLSATSARDYISTVLSSHTGPPHLVLSHGDRDHYSYIPTVMAAVQAGHIWMGGEPDEYTSDAFPAWLSAQRTGGATVHDGMLADWHNDGQPLGTALSCGLANSYVLTVNTGQEKNTNSLVLMIEYGEFTAVFTGDAEGLTEARAVANFQNNLKATVLTGSHHGARPKGSNSVSWAEATAPEVLVFSAGEKFDHPTCTAVNRFAAAANTLEHAARCGEGGAYRTFRTRRAHYMTKASGTIIVNSNGHSPLALHCTGSADCDVTIPH